MKSYRLHPLLFVIVLVALLGVLAGMLGLFDHTNVWYDAQMWGRFEGMYFLQSKMQDYVAAHEGNPPTDLTEVVDETSERTERDAQKNRNLKQVVLIRDAIARDDSRARPNRYKWLVALYVPKATLPRGRYEKTDCIFWCGQVSDPSVSPIYLNGPIAEVAKFEHAFGAEIVEKARQKYLEDRAFTATQPIGSVHR